MISLLMSAFILGLPIVLSICLWYLGLVARCCLLLMCITGAVEVESVINPDKGIREKYEQLFKCVDETAGNAGNNTGWHCAN